jgi:hypothetical protein
MFRPIWPSSGIKSYIKIALKTTALFYLCFPVSCFRSIVHLCVRCFLGGRGCCLCFCLDGLGSLAYSHTELIRKLWILQTLGKTPWTGDQPVARPLPTHDNIKREKNADIQASSGVRAHDPSVRAGEDISCCRPLGSASSIFIKETSVHWYCITGHQRGNKNGKVQCNII